MRPANKNAVCESACERIAQRLFEAFARLLCRIWCPLRVVGRENLPDVPYMICANHSSHLDSIVLMIAVGQPFGSFALMAARDYFFGNKLRSLTMGCLLKLIPLDRSARPYSLRTTLACCADFLKQGNRGLILFPEGTRSATADIGPFKPGADLFSQRLGIPVIPVCIDGTHRVMPKGRLFPRRGTVTVLIGEMLWPRGDRSIVLEVRSRILALKGNLS